MSPCRRIAYGSGRSGSEKQATRDDQAIRDGSKMGGRGHRRGSCQSS